MQTLWKKYPLEVKAYENAELEIVKGKENWAVQSVGGVSILVRDEEITVTVHCARLEEGERVLVVVSNYPQDITFKETFIPSTEDFDDEIEKAFAFAVNQSIIYLFNELEFD